MNQQEILHKRKKIAVVGASGVVGRLIVQILEERNFPVSELLLFSSNRSAGKSLLFRSNALSFHELKRENDLSNFDIVFFAAGSEVSRKFAPAAADAGAYVIDNSSYFRMQSNVPLVTVEVNRHALARAQETRIIANPNCTTMQMVVALKPLHEAYGLKRVDLVSFQAVSGRGQNGVDEFFDQVREFSKQTQSNGATDALNARTYTGKLTAFPHPIAFNCLPHIDAFKDDGFTGEEHKVMQETKKILNLPNLRVSATCVRVPVFNAHSESVAIETNKPVDILEARRLLMNSPGIHVVDNPSESQYPIASLASGKDPVLVGRLRAHPSAEIPGHGLLAWIVADNLRKGAALNAVQIAEALMQNSNIDGQRVSGLSY